MKQIINPRTGKSWDRIMVEYDNANNPIFPDDLPLIVKDIENAGKR